MTTVVRQVEMDVATFVRLNVFLVVLQVKYAMVGHAFLLLMSVVTL